MTEVGGRATAAASLKRPRSPAVFGPGYRLGLQFARGSSGVVYAAHAVHLDQPVAIKLITPSTDGNLTPLIRSVRERMIYRQIDHPNVVKVHDVIVEDGQAGIVMELVDGGDLKGRLEEAPLSPSETAEMGAQIAAGLGAIHHAGIIHRDLKPGNVLLDTSSGRTIPKISDFGVSRLASEEFSSSELTAGTPLYMAPEAIDGQQPCPAGDVYSLGIMLFEMLARPPFQASGAVEVMALHRSAPPPRLIGGPPGLSELVDRMLAKDPTTRPGAGEVESTLRRLIPALDQVTYPLGVQPSRAKPGTATPGTATPGVGRQDDQPDGWLPANGPERRRLAVPLAAAAVIAVVAVLAIGSRVGRQPSLENQALPAGDDRLAAASSDSTGSDSTGSDGASTGEGSTGEGTSSSEPTVTVPDPANPGTEDTEDTEDIAGTDPVDDVADGTSTADNTTADEPLIGPSSTTEDPESRSPPSQTTSTPVTHRATESTPAPTDRPATTTTTTATTTTTTIPVSSTSPTVEVTLPRSTTLVTRTIPSDPAPIEIVGPLLARCDSGPLTFTYTINNQAAAADATVSWDSDLPILSADAEAIVVASNVDPGQYWISVLVEPDLFTRQTVVILTGQSCGITS